MIARIIAWSAEHRIVVFLVSTLLAVFGALAATNAPLDAVPDLSDTQVVVATEWMGRSADVVEDQVTWPLSTALLGTPGARTVRGQSMAGMSFVYVVFDDGTNPAEARAQVSQILGRQRASLPKGATADLGPDASGVGWVYQYALVDETGELGPADLRSLQKTRIAPALAAIDGVAEVASIGGFTKQVEVALDPDRMLAHGVTFGQVAAAVADANAMAGGGAIELSGSELILRGRNEARSLTDLADAPIWAGGGMAEMSGVSSPVSAPDASDTSMDAMGASGAPAAPRAAGKQATGHLLRVGDVAEVQWAPAPRRGVSDYNGQGETAGGIVIARQGQNALAVIQSVKAAIRELEPTFPAGVKLEPVYDRAPFIQSAVATLGESLGEEFFAVALVILVFLGNFRSALVPLLTLPVAVLAAFIPMYLQGLTINVVSLAGIAVAVGAMVDASIVVVENIHVRLTQWHDSGEEGSRHAVMIAAMQEVGPAAFGSLLVIAVSFIPVFALEGREGRLFGPLAWTKTYCMFIASGLALTLAPALAMVVIRGRTRAEHEDPLGRWLTRIYSPVVRLVVRRRWAVVAATMGLFAVTVPVALALPWEFMPPLDEGTLLYMPTAPPGMSEAEASRVLTAMDAHLMMIPEVATVFGKMGRADTATDPAPLSMAETVIQLKPTSEWREGLTMAGLIREMDGKMQVPGMANAWWMPVQTRIEMLATGLRSPLGLKVIGPDLATIEAATIRLEGILSAVPGTRSAFAERSTGALTLDVRLRRLQAAALGVSAKEVADTLTGPLGGERVGEWIDGRARAPISVRYARDFRTDIPAISEALVERPSAPPVPLAAVADVTEGSGPDMIRSEDGKLVGYVFVDPGDRPVSEWVTDAESRMAASGIAEGGGLGDGLGWSWAGTFQDLDRALHRLSWILPFVVLAIAGVLRANTGSWVATGIVFSAVPFSLVGAVWLMWALDYHLSVAAVVGIIALAGVDAETGVVMLLYLTLAYVKHGGARDAEHLTEVIVEGAARRMRPKLMTVATAMIGLVPIFLVNGTGADLARRIAAPMVGGLASSFALELLVYPALFAIWRMPKRDPWAEIQ